MANYSTWVTATLTDADGNTGKIQFSFGDEADTITLATLAGQVALFLTALGAPGTITNAKVTSVVVSFLYEKAGPFGAVDAEYSRVEDGARLNFLNSSGGRGTLVVPAPVTTVFAAPPNENVVDNGGPIAALITWYTAHVSSRDGSLLNIYNGGVKIGKHARRRAQHKIP